MAPRIDKHHDHTIDINTYEYDNTKCIHPGVDLYHLDVFRVWLALGVTL